MDTSRRHLLQGVSAGLIMTSMDAIMPRMAYAQANTTSTLAPAVSRKIDIISLYLLEQEAKKVRTPGAYAYIADAAGDESTCLQRFSDSYASSDRSRCREH